MASAKAKTETVFDQMPNLEVPAAVRDMAEKGAEQAKETYARLKVAASDASEVVESAYVSATKGLSTLGLKAIETARANTNAAFDHAVALLSVKTVADVVELQTAFLRKQSEAMTAQAKDFTELSQTVAAEMTAPVKAQMDKLAKNAA